MTQVYAELHAVDYEKLLSRIQDQNKKRDIPSWLIKIASSLMDPVADIGTRVWKKSIINSFEKFGVSLTRLKIRNFTLIQNKTGGSTMLNISASITKIDGTKLANMLNGPAKKTKEGDDTLRKAAEIVKPFIGETMDTIPHSAIAELFDLLARDKVIELAGNYGIVLSDISVKPG